MKRKLKKILSNKFFIFSLAFIVMLLYLTTSDLQGNSNDARETIKVIKTFFSSEKYISYVMYKGIYAFLPGIICYNLGQLFHISLIILMKLFHAIGFAYITTIGIPFMISSMFKKEAKVWQKYLFILLMFVLENEVFVFISVDFMSLSILILSINSLIKLSSNKNPKLINYLLPGLLIGICSCLSGQFGPSAIILILYGIYLVIKNNKKKGIKKILLVLSVFIFGLLLTKGIDKAYFKMVVEPAREAGNWLPTGKEWLLTGFTANMRYITYPSEVPDNLGLTLIAAEKLDINAINGGAALYPNMIEIIKIVMGYPVMFCIRWTERLFLGLLNDPHNQFAGFVLISPLFVIMFMGTIVYTALLSIKRRVKKVKDLLNFNTLIVIAFILSALVPSIGHVENRYYFAIRTLIIGVFCLSPFIPTMIENIKKFVINFNFKDIKKYKINYNFIVWLIFLVLVILLYAAIYQSAGVNPNITYEFFE